MKLLLAGVAAGLAWIGVEGAFDAGSRAYRDGRFDDAWRAFAAVDRERGDDAPPELLVDLALAALGAGALDAAEIAAEKAAVRGGGELYAFRDFVLGNAAFVRAERAEAQAGGPEAEPFAFDVAIAYARAAADAWAAAAARGADWPAARRNVERSLRKIDELTERRSEAEKRQQERKKDPKEEPEPVPPKDDEPEIAPPTVAPELDGPELVERLLDRLAAKEREKHEVRQANRRARSADVERDW